MRAYHLDLHQRPALLQPSLAFDIVSQDEGEPFSLRPPRPPMRLDLGSGHDWPNIANLGSHPLDQLPARSRPERSRNEWLKAVVDRVP